MAPKAVQAQAQAQAQKQQAISQNDSLELVKCLLKVSIYHVSYLRGLFPDENFKGVDMRNMDGMHIKMLRGDKCEESKRLMEWVEGGVYDAVKQGYLQGLFFGVSTDPEGNNLLEEYVFNFNYGNDGAIAMDITGGTKNGPKNTKKFNQNPNCTTVRYQVCRLMRMLVQVCQTLDKIPSERYLFMKLTYHDHTPDTYEPPYFAAADENAVGSFSSKPFSMLVGQVGTGHHSVALKVKSTLDAGNDGGDANMQPEDGVQHSGSILSDGEDDMEMDDACQRDQHQSQKLDPKKQAHDDLRDFNTAPDDVHDHGAEQAASDTTQSPVPDEYLPELESITMYCCRRSTVCVTDAMAHFMDIPTEVLEGILRHLAEEGVLEAMGDGETYQVLIRSNTQQTDASQPSVAPPQRPDDTGALATGLKGLSVAGQLRASLNTETMQQAVQPKAPSAAPTRAKSTRVGSKRQAKDSDPGDDAPAVLFDSSQQDGKTRKASFVREPIHQRKRKAVRTGRQ